MTSFSVTSFKKGILEFQKDSIKFPTQQKSNPLFPSGQSSEVFGCPPVPRRFWQLNVHPSGRQGNIVRTLFSVREESRFPLQTRTGKTTCNHPDTRETLSGHGLNKEMREVRYGKVVAQFTVLTLSTSVRTPPREIWNTVNLGLLKHINRDL
jgi:hypothetical protein